MQAVLGGLKEKQSTKYDIAKSENQKRAEFNDMIEERSLNRQVYKKFIKDSYEWRNIELAAVVFSILGLFLAIIDYEIDINLNGLRGLLLLHDKA